MLPLKFRFKYQQNKSPREEKFLGCMDKLFISIHWLTVICFTTASFFTGVSEPDVGAWNMTLYCNKSAFNQILTPIDKKWPLLTILTVSLTIIFLLSVEMVICGPKTRNFLNMVNYFFGLLFAWNVTYILKGVISYPIPSFFQNENLKRYYCCCCKSCFSTKPPENLLKLDKNSRGSFPSFTVCALSYVSLFLFLLCCHLDKSRRFIAKLLALVLPGTVSLIYGWYLWQNNENHLQDIIGGAVIGISLATYISKEVFLSENQKNRFKDDFVSVLMTRELTLASANPDRNTEDNQYTINLYSNDAVQSQQRQQQTALRREPPPPYSIL